MTAVGITDRFHPVCAFTFREESFLFIAGLAWYAADLGRYPADSRPAECPLLLGSLHRPVFAAGGGQRSSGSGGQVARWWCRLGSPHWRHPVLVEIDPNLTSGGRLAHYHLNKEKWRIGAACELKMPCGFRTVAVPAALNGPNLSAAHHPSSGPTLFVDATNTDLPPRKLVQPRRPNFGGKLFGDTGRRDARRRGGPA